jgi:predicted transcriptional regulator
MKDISPILKSLGLLDSEVKTYLKALENGPGTVLDLAKTTGLSRQAVYVAIDSLTSRGLMSNALRGKKRYYAASHPDKLLDYAKRRGTEMNERVQDLERLLPELELASGGEKPVVRVYEGKEGLRAFIADAQTSKPKEIHEIADLEAVQVVMEQGDVQPVRKELKKMNTFVHGLYSGEPTGKTLDSERFILPVEYRGFKSNITVYGDKIALVTLEGKMYSILIESSALAKTMRILFGLALKSAKDFPKK